MKISRAWLNEYVDLKSIWEAQTLAQTLTRLGFEVEEVVDLSRGFEHVKVGQIQAKAKHPDADRLSLCQVTLDGVKSTQIVCGASNMKAGDRVAVALPGADLPNGMKIKAGKIRGQESNGMLCSESELGLVDESEGILILPADAELGRSVAEVLGRLDVVLELSITPNRGDALSMFGIARELAAFLGQPLKRPQSVEAPQTGARIETTLEVSAELGSQFFGVEVTGVRVGPSPRWLRERLERVGQRSVNNVVDVTNYVMLELGHPVHAYDSDRIPGKKISIAHAKGGEHLKLLDGSEVTLKGDEIVIRSGDEALGLAGVMGGTNSEVREDTQNLYLEVAEFSTRQIRIAAKRYAKHSEASRRFERGVDSMAVSRVMGRLLHLILETCGGKATGGSYTAQSELKARTARVIDLRKAFVSEFLGTSVADAECELILDRLGFTLKDQGGSWMITVPSWRRDVEREEDLIEEIMRFLGFDRIPKTLPVLRALSDRGADLRAAQSRRYRFQEYVKDALATAGLSEVVPYAFTASTTLQSYGLPDGVELLNPISEEFQTLSPQLLPLLLETYRNNRSRHFGGELLSARLFSVRNTFRRAQGSDNRNVRLETGVVETLRLSVLMTGPRLAGGLRYDRGELDFFDIKGVVESLLERLDARGTRFVAWDDRGVESELASFFHPGQSVKWMGGKDVVGLVGRLHPAFEKKLKVKQTLWIADFNLDLLERVSRRPEQAVQVSAFQETPMIQRDFSLVVKRDLEAEALLSLAQKTAKPLLQRVEVLDVFESEERVGAGLKSISLRLTFGDAARSLEESEVEPVSQALIQAWKLKCGAELR